MRRMLISLILLPALVAPVHAQDVNKIILELLPMIGMPYENVLQFCRNKNILKDNGFEMIGGIEYAVFEYSGFPETFIHLRKEMDVMGSLKIYQNEWFNTTKSLMVKLNSKRRFDEAGDIADDYWYISYGGKDFVVEWSEEQEYMTLLFFLDQ